MITRGYVTLLCMALVLGACGDDPVTPEEPVYLQPTSPENVIENLQTAYRFRDIDGYSSLLAPEFIFLVQPLDVAEFGEFFTRDRDSAGTAALFATPIVSGIWIDLTYDPAEPATEIEFPPGTMKIRVTHTFIEVDETTGITWQIDLSIQDFFFRQGSTADGEDPTHWLIIEWREIPGGVFGPTEKKFQPPSPRITWAWIKSAYR